MRNPERFADRLARLNGIEHRLHFSHLPERQLRRTTKPRAALARGRQTGERALVYHLPFELCRRG